MRVESGDGPPFLGRIEMVDTTSTGLALRTDKSVLHVTAPYPIRWVVVPFIPTVFPISHLQGFRINQVRRSRLGLYFFGEDGTTFLFPALSPTEKLQVERVGDLSISEVTNVGIMKIKQHWDRSHYLRVDTPNGHLVVDNIHKNHKIFALPENAVVGPLSEV